SMEVLEYACNIPLLAYHRGIFDPESSQQPPREIPRPRHWIGKAILFARAPVTFPRDGPWMATLCKPWPLDQLPAFADIPPAGQVSARSRPILTLFARADPHKSCLDTLREITADLDRWLFRA